MRLIAGVLTLGVLCGCSTPPPAADQPGTGTESTSTTSSTTTTTVTQTTVADLEPVVIVVRESVVVSGATGS